jgi:ribosomal protein S18 acetylase RimI-like enzyme
LHLYDISLRAHQINYKDLIPASQLPRFLRHYTDTPLHREQFTTRHLKALDNSNWTIWSARIDGTIVGYAEVQRLYEDRYAIRGIFVDPDHQSKGVGNALYETALHTLGSVHLTLRVIEANHRAIHFYEKYGFVAVSGSSVYFYGAGQITMVREPQG